MKLLTKLVLTLTLGGGSLMALGVGARSYWYGNADRSATTDHLNGALEATQVLVQSSVASITSRVQTVASQAPKGVGVHQLLDSLPDSLVLDEGECLVAAENTGRILGSMGALPMSEQELTDLLGSSFVAGRVGIDGLRAGLVQVDPAPLVVASLPVDAHSDKRHGVRLVLLSEVSDLGGEGSLGSNSPDDIEHVEMASLRDGALPEHLAHVPALLWSQDGRGQELTDGGLRGYAALDDASGRPGFLLAVTVPPSDVATLPQDAILGAILAAALYTLLATWFVRSQVVAPLDRMGRHADRLARTEHGTLSFYTHEVGEIGLLADSLDQLLRKVDHDRAEFVRSARIAGMSDVSSGVVHSAGNILNGVNVSTNLVSRELSNLTVEDLRAAVGELEQNRSNLTDYVARDPNGQFVLPFLAAMTEALADVKTKCVVELESIEHSVDHVNDLIRNQEKYAIGATVVEEIDLAEVIDLALQVAMLASERSSQVHVQRDFASIAAVRIDRHKFTSVMINILANAFEALADVVDGERMLELAVYPMGGERFVVEVTDTGIGIAPEDLDLLFSPNFSTKEGAAGQGLHTAANLCKEMGIAIGAVSDGVGCGTTFKLRVPFTPPVNEALIEPEAVAEESEGAPLRLASDF